MFARISPIARHSSVVVRAKNIKHVFVLGINDGVFPADAKDNGFFTDTDKITLETMGINLSSLSDTRYNDELLSFKHAVSLASDTLTVSCLKSNIKGAQMQPSIAYTRLCQLVGKDFKIIDTSSLLPIDKIFTKETAIEQIGSYDECLGQAVREYYGIDFNEKNPFVNEQPIE